MKNCFVHQNAIVETDNIGDSTKIWAFVHILPGVTIGKNVNICDHCFIEDGVEIGDNVTIKSGVYMWKGLKIEDNVFVGPSVAFSNDRFPRSKNRNFKLERITLSKGCSIGANVTILPGVIVGKYALVGAGSVITRNVADYSIVYGNPAIHRGYICICGNKMIFKENVYECDCGKKYKKTNDKVNIMK